MTVLCYLNNAFYGKHIMSGIERQAGHSLCLLEDKNILEFEIQFCSYTIDLRSTSISK